MGTELLRRGVDTRLPLWSAWGLIEAPQTTRQIHREYLLAGAQIITTNTFRTHRRSLSRAGHGDCAEQLTRLAVELAEAAITDVTMSDTTTDDVDTIPAVGICDATTTELYLAGCVAPLEDCFSPQLTPGDSELQREHSEIIRHLVDAGVDLILVETMPTVREAVAAARSAMDTSLPTLVGLTCTRAGRLWSEETVAEAVEALEPLQPDALLINCTPTEILHQPLQELCSGSELPIGAYGNIVRGNHQTGAKVDDQIDPATYAEFAGRWLDLGATMIGSCCGTSPDYIRALAGLLATRPQP